LPRSGRVVEIFLKLGASFVITLSVDEKSLQNALRMIQPKARKKDRYMETLKKIALFLGGEVGSRLSK
jgi:hypothetical protein